MKVWHENAIRASVFSSFYRVHICHRRRALRLWPLLAGICKVFAMLRTSLCICSAQFAKVQSERGYRIGEGCFPVAKPLQCHTMGSCTPCPKTTRRIVTWMSYTLILPACLEQRATGVRTRTLVHGMQLKHFKAATILGLAFKIAPALALNRSEATDRA